MTEAAVSVPPRFAKRVRRARLELGLDQRSFAKRLSVSEKTVRRWESGESLPRPAHLDDLARVTRKPISWFTEALSDDEL